MKKNVLFIGVTEYHLENSSHLQRKFTPLSREMGVFVIARAKSPEGASPLFGGRRFHEERFGAHFYLISSRMLFAPLAFGAGVFLCLKRDIHTIVAQGPLVEGMIGFFLALLFRKEFIVEIHGDWREGPFVNKKRLFPAVSKKLVPLFANICFRKADKIRGVGEYFLRDLRKKYTRKKYFVFPTYSDLSLYCAEKHTNFRKYICTAAVLSPIKDIGTLLLGFSRIRGAFPDYKLVIAGGGPAMESLRAQAGGLKIEKSVIFTGRLSSQELKDVMRDCWVFVLPSLSEGVPRVLLEAMMLRKPVIATNVGGIPEIVKDGVNGFLFEPKDVEVLATKLKELLGIPECAKKMGEAGRAFAEANFSNEKYIENYISMIYQ